MNKDTLESMARLFDRLSTVMAKDVKECQSSLYRETQKQQLMYAISQNWLAEAEAR